MADRRDELKACNDQGIPLEDFKLAFCDRCLNPECTRSVAGQSRFEQRVSTWYERLFKAPDRLNEADPRFTQIRAKRFIDVDPGPIPEVGRSSAWIDPRDLVAAAPEPQPEPEVEAVELDEALSPPQVTPQPVETTPAPEPEQEPEVPPQPSPGRPPAGFMNTPTPRPQTLDGSKKAPTKPAQPVFVDPWEPQTPKPVEEGVQVVQPGARFRFGGSGV